MPWRGIFQERNSIGVVTVDHLRWDLRAIFRLAVQDRLLGSNPAEMLFTPRTVARPSRRILSPAQVQQILSALSLRKQLIVRLARFPASDPVRFLPCNGSISPTITSRWRSVSTAGNWIAPRANARHETLRYHRRHGTGSGNGGNRVGRRIPTHGSFLRQSGPRHSAATMPGEGSLRRD